MKRLLTCIVASILCFNLYATINTTSTINDLFDGEEIIVTPDSIHLFFHGCSPHGEFVTITNNSSEMLIINRIYSDNFILNCLLNGEYIFESSLFLSPGETIEFIVYVSPFKDELDSYGKMYIDTDVGLYSITIYYEEHLGVQANQAEVKLFPNPADDHVTLNVTSLDKVSVFNTLGQKVDEFLPEHDEIVIPTTNYQSGIYFVKANGQTLKFVVTH